MSIEKQFSVSVEVQGLDDLAQQLNRLVNDAMAKQEVQNALLNASLPMVKAIRARAPIAEKEYFRYFKGGQKTKKGITLKRRELEKPGNLRKSVARKRVFFRRTAVGVGIYFRKIGFYWRFLEYGTPRMAAKPFVRNSFDENRMIALERFKKRLKQNVDKVVARQQIAQALDSEGE